MNSRDQGDLIRGKVFRGSSLVDALLERHPDRFFSRAAALGVARALHREGIVAGVFGARSFEDTAQLYVWCDDVTSRRHQPVMTSTGGSQYVEVQQRGSRLDQKLIQDLKQRVQGKRDYNIITSCNSVLQEHPQDIPLPVPEGGCMSDIQAPLSYPWERFKHESNYSTDSSLDTRTYCRTNDVNEYVHSVTNRRRIGVRQSGDDIVLGSRTCTGTHGVCEPHVGTNSSWNNERILGFDKRSQKEPADECSDYDKVKQHCHEYSNFSRSQQLTGKCRTEQGEEASRRPRPQSNLSFPLGRRARVEPSRLARSASRKESHSGVGATLERPETAAPRESAWQDASSLGRGTDAFLDSDPPTWETPLRRPFSSPKFPPPGLVRMEPRLTDPLPQPAQGSDVRREEGAEGEEGLGGEAGYSYSDNEKHLLEEMKRMKLQHQTILRTYECRINKLMAKMHELRSIAEMLENSSTKSSPYGLLPHKHAPLGALGPKMEEELRQATGTLTQDPDVPPPLPPRPGRGGRVYPNRPIVSPRVPMQPLPWTRLILPHASGDSGQSSVWHGMQEPELDTEEMERLFRRLEGPEHGGSSLYDDVARRRGQVKPAEVGVYEAATAERLATIMRLMACSLDDVKHALNSMEAGHLDRERLTELLVVLTEESEKIVHHGRRKSPSHVGCPELLMLELSKVDHLRERVNFLRFKRRLYVNLFEIDQQLNEVQTACDEVTNRAALKTLLQTVLGVGNYLNGSSDSGQADGFHLPVLNTLKDMPDRTGRGSLLDLVVRLFCQRWQSGQEGAGPACFPLPEPATMRHAAQVSFDEIERALVDLSNELSKTRERLEAVSSREDIAVSASLTVSGENFLAAALEVLWEQERHLEETRSQFCKTTAFFLYDKAQDSPPEFFQIWAAFLHDVKYSWKLAQRTMARDRFELDFNTKTQLSACSIPGLAGLKSRMMRQLAAVTSDTEARAAKAHHLRHINSWLESVGRYALEMQVDHALTPHLADVVRSKTAVGKKTSQPAAGSGRTPSPLALTARPPDVHRPQPASPVEDQLGAQSSGHSGDYENDAAPYECLARVQPLGQPSPAQQSRADGALDTGHKKGTQFSLRSWLRRDAGRRGEEGGGSGEGSKSSTGGSTSALGKLRHSVVARLSKRPQEALQQPGASPQPPPLPPKSERLPQDCPPTPGAEASARVGARDGDLAGSLEGNYGRGRLRDGGGGKSRHGERPREASGRGDSAARPAEAAAGRDEARRNIREWDGSKESDRWAANVGEWNLESTAALDGERELWGSRGRRPLQLKTGLSSDGRGKARKSDSCRAPLEEAGNPGKGGSAMASRERNLGQEETPRGRGGGSRGPRAHSEPRRPARHFQTYASAVPGTRSSGGEASNPSTFSSLGSSREESLRQGGGQPERSQVPSGHSPRSSGPTQAQGSRPRPRQARDRAPLLLGSNASISEVTEAWGQRPPDQTEERDPSRLWAEATPVYTAQSTPNYENQGKVEPRRSGTQGQTDNSTLQLLPQGASHTPQQSLNGDEYRQELQKKSELYISWGYGASPQCASSPRSPHYEARKAGFLCQQTPNWQACSTPSTSEAVGPLPQPTPNSIHQTQQAGIAHNRVFHDSPGYGSVTFAHGEPIVQTSNPSDGSLPNADVCSRDAHGSRVHENTDSAGLTGTEERSQQTMHAAGSETCDGTCPGKDSLDWQVLARDKMDGALSDDARMVNQRHDASRLPMVRGDVPTRETVGASLPTRETGGASLPGAEPPLSRSNSTQNVQLSSAQAVASRAPNARDRTPVQASSISSLIERFEKHRNQDVRFPPSQIGTKPFSITSASVISKKTLIDAFASATRACGQEAAETFADPTSTACPLQSAKQVHPFYAHTHPATSHRTSRGGEVGDAYTGLRQRTARDDASLRRSAAFSPLNATPPALPAMDV